MPLTTMSDERKGQTLLITVIAGAISSVAFGVSVFAMGIIWLIPSVRPPTPEISVRPKLKDNARRRSAPPILQHSERKLVVPSILETELVSSLPSHQNSPRRVYFLDSQIRPSSQRRYSDLTNLSSQVDETTVSSTFLSVQQDDAEISPGSSSSTLVHVIEIPSHSSSQLEPCQESIESDSTSSSRSRPDPSSSPRPSLSLTTHLKSSWVAKKSSHSQSGGDSGGETTQSDDATPSSSRSARRSSLGFTPPWISSKKRSQTVDLASPSASPVTPKQILFPACSPPGSPQSMLPYFSRTQSLNNHRRTSAPVRAPRTNPYSFPYFAEPPTVTQQGERRPSSVTSSEESVTTGNLSIRTPEHRTADERRQQNAEAQASLGHGRRPTQRRAVSEMVSVLS